MHLSRLPPHDDAQRTAGETPSLPESVVEVSDVMLLHQVGVVAEHRDGRRSRLDLRSIVELDLPARCLRWLPACDKGLESGVHLRCRDSLLPFGLDVQNHAEDLAHSLSREGRKKDERHELEERSLLLALLLELVGR